MERYKKLLIIFMSIVALGTAFSTTLADLLGTLGTVFVAIGGLLFIAAMKEKRNNDENHKDDK